MLSADFTNFAATGSCIPGNEQMEAIPTLTYLYESALGAKPDLINLLPGAGSDRRYFRIKRGSLTHIGAEGTDADENRRFIALARIMRSEGIEVPEVYAVADGAFPRQYYIVEDFGDTSLFSRLDSEEAPALLRRTVTSLAAIHEAGPRIAEKLNREGILLTDFGRICRLDMNYFKYCFLKPSGVAFDELKLEDEFDQIAAATGILPDSTFMLRDCQSRNVQIKPNGIPAWLDFQGALAGPALYDLMSLLWQAKAGLGDVRRNELLAHYCAERMRLNPTGSYYNDRERVAQDARLLALVRTLQVLGAYGFRGLVERKAHFLESIRPALANLASLIGHGAADSWPELKRVCTELARLSKFASPTDEGLTVTVFSFSYKKGYPDDFSGNGGGFMFDCRGMHNPGRYDEFKPLTGIDLPVIDFLEERGEVQPFLENAWGMTDPCVATYLRRGFTSLQIGFGCTGGRHRSVYCAEHTASHIAGKFPEAVVKVIHREQGIERIRNSNSSK